MSHLQNSNYVEHVIEGMLELSHDQEMERRLEKKLAEGPSAEEMAELDEEEAIEKEKNA